MKHLSSLALFLLAILVQSSAQEIESPLVMSAEIRQHYLMEKSYPERTSRGGGSLELPFVDDFSRYSLPTNNPNIPVDWQRWEDESAYLNGTFPLAPPTIGVATLDGLDRTGYPYNFSNPDAYGPADTLTSMPIRLQTYAPEDNVYLSFFYQPQGRGNNPDEADSLIVEFFSPDDDAWFHMWSIPGLELQTFQRVFIQVSDPWFFRDGFKFRFRNYATLSGALDHWHIDYVILDENVDPNNFDLIDVAIVHPVPSLLIDYTAMPWTHFISNPSQFMANTVGMDQGNLNEDRNIVSGFRVSYEGSQLFDQPNLYLNTTGNGFSQFESTMPIAASPANFVYDSSVNDTCAFFDVEMYTNTTPDQNRWNDTLRFVQEFTNYYAYDDGSAELAYALNQPGSRLAVKFQSHIPDTLLGVLIHFTPFRDDVSDETFLLRAWSDAGGLPGAELGENFIFNSPQYFENGYNVFQYYPYDNPIPVDGVFYVGWTQNSAAKLNIGNDKSGVSNTSRLFYTLGVGTSWALSTITGSVMIRPVLRSGKQQQWVGVEEPEWARATLYPNPAASSFNIQWEQAPETFSVELWDISGRLVKSYGLSAGQSMAYSIEDVRSGLYFVKASDVQGNILFSQKLLVE